MCMLLSLTFCVRAAAEAAAGPERRWPLGQLGAPPPVRKQPYRRARALPPPGERPGPSRAAPSRAGRSPGVGPRCAGAGRRGGPLPARGGAEVCRGGACGPLPGAPRPRQPGRCRPGRPGVTAGTIPRGPGRPPPAPPVRPGLRLLSGLRPAQGSGKGQSCPGLSSAFPPASLAVALAKPFPGSPTLLLGFGRCGRLHLRLPWVKRALPSSSQKSTPALREEFLTLRGHPVAACSSEDIRPVQRDSDSAPKRLTLVGIASSSYGAEKATNRLHKG
ncbi:translation initiation factor IF-2-like [Aquila chrysaetos chrysaetos]|uniref:translation initiation factor IF-2-like n=1 Tax=Aquila chrysaetos chrysaetos TaxID=223781 RepID=UPI001B7D2C61|nr:translation initiation factor IF-2-like [Aquila chrysaetos chrysaetos]